MPEKRIALCLFGHMRTWNETWQSLFKYVVYPNEVCDYKFTFKRSDKPLKIKLWRRLISCFVPNKVLRKKIRGGTNA